MEKIRIGIFGAGRGVSLSKNFMLLGCEIVALCDSNEQRRNKARETLGETVIYYDSFDEFVKHDMDAVILANNFHEHTPFAIECFKHGLHVFSECISNITMAEGVKLIHKQFDEFLNKIGVEEIPAEGLEFDPNLHSAVFHEDIEGEPENTVSEVLQKGYRIGERIIRHAMVKVVN